MSSDHDKSGFDQDPRIPELAHHMTEMMKILGMDMSDVNLTETPERVARMYLEVFSSINGGSEPKITVFDNTENYSTMVTVRDIPFYSMCAHHFVPFFGVAHVGYIPTDKIVGLSKIARIVKFYSRRPQIQERMAENIVDYLQEKLKPEGAMVVLQARHLCMEMRGIEASGSKTITDAIRGSFHKLEVRSEFLNMLKTAGWNG